MLKVLVLVLSVLTPLTAMASHAPMGRCADPAGVGVVEVNAGPAGVYYVDDRGAAGNGVWLYAESNGVYSRPEGPGVYNDDRARHNLQRGGSSPFLPDDVELCVDDPIVLPDTFIL